MPTLSDGSMYNTARLSGAERGLSYTAFTWLSTADTFARLSADTFTWLSADTFTWLSTTDTFARMSTTDTFAWLSTTDTFTRMPNAF